jgi:hypothetical protein
MLTDECIEERLRQHFAESLEPAEDLVLQVLGRHRHHQLRLAATFGAPLLLVVGAVVAVLLTAVPLRGASPAGTSSPGGGHGVLQLAGYRFHLPQRYRLVSSVRAHCGAIVTMGIPRSTRGSVQSSSTASPDPTATVVSAADRTGGCVTMLLTPVFTPTSTTPVPYLRSGRAAPSTQVQVGPYTGWLTTQGRVTSWLESQGLAPTAIPGPDLQLSVEIPEGGGEYRLLDVGSQGIAEPALLGIVSRGLTP